MLRRTLPIAVCCLAVVIGCGKKEPAPAGAPAAGKGAAVQAPEGMVVLGEKPPVFLTKGPITISQYVQYMKASGQPVPETMRAVALGGPGGDQPVTELTRKQAERCAAWDLKRLPTQQEWTKATTYVAGAPYPWEAVDDSARAVTPLYLVQDWLPGSPEEQRAQARRQDLVTALEAERAAGFGKARQDLADLVKARKAAADERWQQFKPAFFSLVDKQKRLAELNGQKACRQDILAILSSVAAEKGKLAAAIALHEGDTQAAIKTYQDKLAVWRSDLQKTRQSLDDKAKELQQDVVKQTDAFDQAAAKAIADKFAEADALLQQSTQAPVEPKDAAALQSKLVAALEDLKAAPAPLENLPDPAAVTTQVADVQQQIDKSPADKESADRIAAAKGRIQALTENVSQDFLDEKLLLQEVDTLVDLRGRRDAVQANLAALTGAMRQLAAPEPKPE